MKMGFWRRLSIAAAFPKLSERFGYHILCRKITMNTWLPTYGREET